MVKDLDQVFAALSDPTRREILNMLLEDDMAVTDVAEPFEMSLAAILKHPGVLAAVGAPMKTAVHHSKAAFAASTTSANASCYIQYLDS